MDYSEYKQKMFQFFQSGISHSKDDDKIEAFYCFIDELVEIAATDSKFYELVADCYMQMSNPEKAKEAFLKFYEPANKKHVKKLYNYDRCHSSPVPRPSKQPKVLPDFPYVAPSIASKKFVIEPEQACRICKKKNVPLYTGLGYAKDAVDKAIFFAYEDEKFCVDCLINGAAAKQLDIYFQTPYIEGFTRIPKETRDLILKHTPSCSSDFAIYSEDVWPACCNDFCRYLGKTDYTTFSFECIHCGKKKTMSTELEDDYEDEDF